MLSFWGPPERTWKGGHQLPPLANVGDMIDEEEGIKGHMIRNLSIHVDNSQYMGAYFPFTWCWWHTNEEFLWHFVDASQRQSLAFRHEVREDSLKFSTQILTIKKQWRVLATKLEQWKKVVDLAARKYRYNDNWFGDSWSTIIDGYLAQKKKF